MDWQDCHPIALPVADRLQHPGLQKPQVSLVDIRPAASTLLEQNFDADPAFAEPQPAAIKASGLNLT
jgi:Fe-S-cluster formation regulator IscX/YfhJ